MKILIFGCGVIGSVYATFFAKAGIDVSVYARGHRLQELQEKGLLYQTKGTVLKADVTITNSLEGRYDFVFVTVKYEQLLDALKQVAMINSPNIVTMVNTPNGYEEGEMILGKGRWIPAFPGAGGTIENGILKATVTPAFIQKTTYGEVDEQHTRRMEELKKIFKKSHIPSEECKNMMDWQLCHLAMVIPMADAIYRDGGDNYSTGHNKQVMLQTAKEIQQNLKVLKQRGMSLQPFKMNLFLFVSPKLIAKVLAKLYASNFGTCFINAHAQKARKEMMTLREDYYHKMQIEE